MALFLTDFAGETSLKRISYQQGRAEHAMRFFHASTIWAGGDRARRLERGDLDAAPALPGVRHPRHRLGPHGLMGAAIRARRVRPEAIALCWKAREALIEQAIDWNARPFLERQQMLREFRVRAGRPVDDWLEILGRIERELISGPGGHVGPAPLDRLAAFYDHLGDLDCGSAIEPAWRVHELRDVDRRAADVRRLADLLEPVPAVASR